MLYEEKIIKLNVGRQCFEGWITFLSSYSINIADKDFITESKQEVNMNTHVTKVCTIQAQRLFKSLKQIQNIYNNKFLFHKVWY